MISMRTIVTGFSLMSCISSGYAQEAATLGATELVAQQAESFALTWSDVTAGKQQIAKEITYNGYLQKSIKVAALLTAAYYTYDYFKPTVVPEVAAVATCAAHINQVAATSIETLPHDVQALKGGLSALHDAVGKIVVPEKKGWLKWGKDLTSELLYQGAIAMAATGVYGFAESAVKKVFHDDSMQWLLSSRVRVTELTDELLEYAKLIETEAALAVHARSCYGQCMATACKKLFDDMAIALGFMQYKKEASAPEKNMQIDAMIDYLFITTNDFGTYMQTAIAQIHAGKQVAGLAQAIKKFQVDMARTAKSFMHCVS